MQPLAAILRRVLVLVSAALLSGCYFHGMGGAVVAKSDGYQTGGSATLSGGLNGPLGGVGVNANGIFFDQQASGMLGLEAFRIWRSPSLTGVQPYVRGALGLLELGSREEEFFWGALSPRAEAGVLWLTPDLLGLSLSAAAEYRPRSDGFSTPVFWVQVGFGQFDFFQPGS